MSGSNTATVRGEMAPEITEFSFSAENEAEIEKILKRYPEARKASAVMPLLHLAQRQHGGWLPRAILDHIAERLEMPKIRVYEVASFYDMYNTEPTGRVQVRVCTTTPCWLCGSDDIVRACKDALGIDIGESTEDGRFFLREFECLGACANAPMMWIDDDYYEDLNYDRARALIEQLKAGERPTPGPQSGRKGSVPAGGRTSLFEMDASGGQSRGDGPAADQAPVDKARPETEVREHHEKAARDGDPAAGQGDAGAAGEAGKRDAE